MGIEGNNWTNINDLRVIAEHNSKAALKKKKKNIEYRIWACLFNIEMLNVEGLRHLVCRHKAMKENIYGNAWGLFY